VDPVPDSILLSENLVEPGIEPRPLNLQPETLTTKPQRWSAMYLHPVLISDGLSAIGYPGLKFIVFCLVSQGEC
jgi:hypothetical protein